MAHWSEETRRLERKDSRIRNLDELDSAKGDADVWLFRLPFPRSGSDANSSLSGFRKLSNFCKELSDDSTVCILTTPADAAIFLPYLEDDLKFQLWIALKTNPDSFLTDDGRLPESHAALLILTKYRKALRHTKTRVQYSYCPACLKTTKDYGGKKHTYHQYGTLLSDIWKDIEYQPHGEIIEIAERLADLFGLDPYRFLRVIDLRGVNELQPTPVETVQQRNANHHNQSHLESQLINDDCLSALARVPDSSVDFCFSDPPYNLQKKYDKSDDSLESSEYFSWCDKWLLELYRVLKPGRTLAVLNIPIWAARHFQYLNLFADFQSWIAWDGLSFPVRQIMPAHYGIVCVSKGRPRPLRYSNNKSLGSAMALDDKYCIRASCVSSRNRYRRKDQIPITDLWSDIHRLKHNSRRVDHPCQLPPTLMQRLYETFTHPGELVLDPFNGAGTSTLVAQQMERRYIGIELSAKYHEITRQRHSELSNGLDPFAKTNRKPGAKNSRVARMQKQKYAVSKKTLQLEVRRIALELDRLPNKQEVGEMSNFPIEYFENYFASWGEVCAAARTTGMSETVDSPKEDIQFSLFS